MKGVYIHIPFCVSRCRYCDFYSTTCLDRREDYIQAVVQEAAGRIADGSDIRTIYFGGGTPSQLTAGQVKRIVESLRLGKEGIERKEGTESKESKESREVTMEVNPGDVTVEYLRAVREAGINRLSIGIQSFRDELLQRIGRRHTAQQAIEAVHAARQAGLDNLSIDLIYGLPGQTMQMWQQDIEQALALHPEHISTYCLSYEEGTVLTRMRDEGQISEQDDDTLNEMYDTLCQQLKDAGYEHYEVSNFALPNRRSRHNSSYWNDKPYIGLGAGAHSYDGQVRSWNPSDLDAYIAGTLAHNLLVESETLTPEQKHEESIMLRLRTSEGVSRDLLTGREPIVQRYIASGLLVEKDGNIIATQQGLHILNTIITDLI